VGFAWRLAQRASGENPLRGRLIRAMIGRPPSETALIRRGGCAGCAPCRVRMEMGGEPLLLRAGPMVQHKSVNLLLVYVGRPRPTLCVCHGCLRPDCCEQDGTETDVNETRLDSNYQSGEDTIYMKT